MTIPDSKWSKGRDCWRWMGGRHLRVTRSTRGYWLAKLDGETRPTQHSSREAAKRAAERRAKP